MGTRRPKKSSGPAQRGRSGAWLAIALAVLPGCDAINPIPFVGSITLSPESALLDTVGDTIRFAATAKDRNGVTIPQPGLRWRSSDESVATVDESGLAVAVGSGSTTITAFVGAVVGSATLEVLLSPLTENVVAGEVYHGRRQYTEYRAGDLPFVIAAPHGGLLEPAEIPDRTVGVVTRDRNTQELARAIASAVQVQFGGVPHLVVNRLHRVKLDANREIVEAAQGNPFAERAWEEYHAFIDAAKQQIIDAYGRGLFIDLHGHGHDIQRVELGYLLKSEQLALSDDLLDTQTLIDQSSIRSLVEFTDAGFVALVRGTLSMGSLLEAEGFPAVPSVQQPDPGSDPYFTGGYSTARHGSRDGGTVSGVQIEAHWTGLRDDAPNRERFADALADALAAYLTTHFDIQLGVPARCVEPVGC